MDPRRSPSSSTSHPEQASGPRHELGAQYASLETPSATRVIGGKFDQRDGQRPECAVVPGMTDVLAACERANGIVTPLGAPARLFVRRSEKRIGPPLCPSLRRLSPQVGGLLRSRRHLRRLPQLRDWTSVGGLAGSQCRHMGRVDADRISGAMLLEPSQSRLARSSCIRKALLNFIQLALDRVDVAVSEPDLRVRHRRRR